MKTSLRRLTSAVLLVALGAALYLAMPLLQRWSQATPSTETGTLVDSPLAQIQVEGVDDRPLNRDRAGNVVMANCLVALERRSTITANLVQSGRVAGQIVETSGAYRQSGLGDRRKFSFVLQGRIGGATTRVWQVCNGRYLWTDTAWDATSSPGRRQLKRIDLADVRERVRSRSGPQHDLTPGSAAPEAINPHQWVTLGGLPMLVGALAEKFDFGTPRQMSLRNEPVYAMIGRWKPAQRDALLSPPQDDQAKADPKEGALALPERMPHHVLVAIGARDLFPHLIEYRSVTDPLSTASIVEDARFRQSASPLLKMDFLKPRFNVPVDPQHFVYQKPEGIDFSDQTEQRIAMLEARASAGKLSRRSGTTSGGQQR